MLKQNQLLDFEAQVIEMFEDFLEEKGFTNKDFWNSDKEDYVKDDGFDNLAIIYGEDYYELENRIYWILKNNRLIEGE